MQCVLLAAKASAGHVPEVPVHISATSHCPAEARQVTLVAWYVSTHELALPEQRSDASSSHGPPCELPAQWVVADAKPSAGHAPEVPVQLSATSHWPADARQVTLAAWYASTHVLPLPEQ